MSFEHFEHDGWDFRYSQRDRWEYKRIDSAFWSPISDGSVVGALVNALHPRDPRCCYIPCEEKAKFTLSWSPHTADDYTESCEAHVGSLIGDAEEVITVTQIGFD